MRISPNFVQKKKPIKAGTARMNREARALIPAQKH